MIDYLFLFFYVMNAYFIGVIIGYIIWGNKK